MEYELLISRTFQNQLLRVPAKELPRVMEKIDYLRRSPQIDSKTKKRLVNYEGNVYRIRSGDYRILYTYGKGWIKLLGIDLRRDVYHHYELVDTAGPLFDINDPPKVDDLLNAEEVPVVLEYPSLGIDARSVPELAPTPLGRDITKNLLERIRVDKKHQAELLGCKTDVDLINAKIPPEVRDAVFDVLVAPNYDEVLVQPSLGVGETEDLARFYGGDLVIFHLQLDDHQRRVLRNLANHQGPYYLNGPPGTGKTTVILHALNDFLKHSELQNHHESRVLYTTFTNVLEESARQILTPLCGPALDRIDLKTVNSLALGIVGKKHGHIDYRDDDDGDVRDLFRDAVSRVSEVTLSVGEESVALTPRSEMTLGYLWEEIDDVIVGRNLSNVEEYLPPFERSGRKVPLGINQRKRVWEINSVLTGLLEQSGIWTWSRIRREALSILLTRPQLIPRYDAVFVDEAQDLDSNALGMILEIAARSPNALMTLYVAADPNQSIYGSGFSLPRSSSAGAGVSWHQYRMTTGHRTTREIVLAAEQYLRGQEGAELYSDKVTTQHPLRGPRPTASYQNRPDLELQRIMEFFSVCTRAMQLGMDMCAVLCPDNKLAKELSVELSKHGVPAKYMTRKEFDFQFQGVKVLTRHSAKGIEFPIVALSLFRDRMRTATLEGESDERDGKDHRLNHMAMTRAMRSLLVTLPNGLNTNRYADIREPLWDVEHEN